MKKSLSDFQQIFGVHAKQWRSAFCSKANAGLQGLTGYLIIREIGFGGVDANRQGQGLEETEQRPQLMIEHQCMPLAATGRGQQHGGVDQRIEIDQVEQVLEQAGVRTAINRGGDDQQISAFDGLQLGFNLGTQFLAGKGGAQWSGNVAQFDQLALDRQLFGQFRQQGLGQYQSAGRTPGTAGEGNNFQWTRHDQFLFKQLLREQ